MLEQAHIRECLERCAFADAAQAIDDVLRTRLELRLELAEEIRRIPLTTLNAYPRLLRALALIELDHGRGPEALVWLERAERGFSEQENPSALIDCQMDRVLIARDRLDWALSNQILEDVTHERLDGGQRLRLLNLQAVRALACDHDFRLAASLFRQIESEASASGARSAHLTAVINRGLGVERVLGQFENMIECSAILERHYGGDIPVEDQVYAARLRAEAHFYMGHPETERELRALLALSKKTSDPTGNNPHAAGYALGLLALFCAEQGRLEEAERYASEGARRSLPQNSSMVFVYMARARVAALRGDLQLAIDRCQDALLDCYPADRRIMALVEAAHCSYIVGDQDSALLFGGQAKSLAAEIGAEYELARTSVILNAIRFAPSDALVTLRRIASLRVEHALALRHPGPFGLFLTRCLEAGLQTDTVIDWASKTAQPCWIIRLFGEMKVIGPRGPLTREDWVRPKTQHLFTYLAYLYPRPVEQVQVIEELWPDADYEDARNSFRVACTYLRRALGPEAVQVQDGMVRLVLPSPHWFDWEAIQHAVKSENESFRRRTIEAVGDGVPLAGYEERWRIEAREHMSRMRSRVTMGTQPLQKSTNL